MDHNCEVWPQWAKRFVWRRFLKSQNKERPFGGHLGKNNHPISTKNGPEWSPRRYLRFDMRHDHIRSNVKFDLHLTPRAQPNFDPGATIWTNLKQHQLPIIHTKFRRNRPGSSWEEDFLRIWAIFRRRPSWINGDLQFYKSEKASPMDHNYEVWPSWAKRFVWRRFLKSQNKERPFDLSAAILEKIILRFRQKMVPSDRLVDIFDLIYDMTIFGQKSNLTPIWPPGARPFLTQGPPYEQI